MNNTNNFVSKKLSEISLEANSIISSHLSQLNRISNDIKMLEATLQKAGMPFKFIYVLFSKQHQYRESLYDYADPYHEIPSVTDFISREDYCLVWGKTSENEYRLSYNIYITKDECEKYYNGDKEKIENILKGKLVLKFSKPFIETKSNIRLKFENELPIFYKKIIECLKTEKEKDCIIFESPNYDGAVSAIFERGISE